MTKSILLFLPCNLFSLLSTILLVVVGCAGTKDGMARDSGERVSLSFQQG